MENFTLQNIQIDWNPGPLYYYFSSDQEGKNKLDQYPSGQIQPNETYRYDGPLTTSSPVYFIVADGNGNMGVSMLDSKNINYTFDTSNLFGSKQARMIQHGNEAQLPQALYAPQSEGPIWSSGWIWFIVLLAIFIGYVVYSKRKG